MKKIKPRFYEYPNYPEPKVRRPRIKVEFNWPKAEQMLSWPADCRWWNYSCRPSRYKPTMLQ